MYNITPKLIFSCFSVPRMGSFTSRPQIASSSTLDDSVEPPEGASHEEFLEWVRRPLSDLPAQLNRQYRSMPPSRPLSTVLQKHNVAPQSPRPATTFRLMQWNILAQGTIYVIWYMQPFAHTHTHTHTHKKHLNMKWHVIMKLIQTWFVNIVQ